MKTPHPTSDPAGFPAESLTPPVDDGGAAFPREARSYQGGGVAGGAQTVVFDIGAQGMSLRDWFAGQCDVSIYTPVETFERKFGRRPTVSELAGYVADIRLIEADSMIAARKGGARV